MTIILDGTTGITTPAINSSGDLELPGGTANGVLYLNGSKVATSGSALVFDGTTFKADAAAVFNDSGADVDFRVEGDTDSNLLFVDASTDRVGVGRNDPTSKLDVYIAANQDAITVSNALGRNLIISSASDGTNDDAVAVFNKNSSVGEFLFKNSGGDRMLLDSSGNLGLGVTPAAGVRFDVRNNSTTTLADMRNANASGYGIYIAAGSSSSQYVQRWADYANNSLMTLNAAGNLGIGTTSPGNFYRLTINGAGTGGNPLGGITFRQNETDVLYFGNIATDNNTDWEIWNPRNGYLRFATNNIERARITSGGEFLVGQTSATVNALGTYINGAGQIGTCISASVGLLINRKTDDGTLVSFRQDDNEEGTISVSGATVSYNAFAGSHWSQLQDGSKPDILRGTVMESINELCVWPGEENERLPKCKISDTAGSRKVYGVFMAWDNDWETTNDMYVTAVGAFVCRVNAGVTVQEGDLLESNGDGTARVQADDLIRSSTIGKVTSTVKTHEYDDGSYCVPTVLYCG
jgi:hypothetical protein